MLRKDIYIPNEDSDRFIDKSILSMLRVLSSMRRKNGFTQGFIYRINPCVKFVFMFLNMIFLSMSRNIIYIVAVNVYFLLILSLMDGEKIKNILAISVATAFFTIVMLIPAMFLKGVANCLILVLKVFGTVMIGNVFSSSTKWSHVTRALKMFFIPDIFIMILDITLKYIFILGEFALDMLYSLKLRSIGKNNRKYSYMSKIMGNLFIKSSEMGEEMYSAMECRGFAGEYTKSTGFRFNFMDILYSAANIILIFFYFYTGA